MKTTKKFQRTIEDFTCEQCGTKVRGNGYTNHCPACLTSKHVDVRPGDRRESCHGLMPPVDIFVAGRNFRVVQRCERCGVVRTCTLTSGDMDAARKFLRM